MQWYDEPNVDQLMHMVRSFGLGIPGTRNVYIGMSVLLVVTSRNKS